MYTGENIGITVSDNGIAELTFDVQNSRVNIFNAQTVDELSRAIEFLESQSNIKGLLIGSAKAAFIAGADINEFAPIFSQGPDKILELLQKSNSNFNRIESLPFPVVAAINGFALGGGCEMVLACDYRMVSEDLRIGLPETRLGIIPGWGGTVRLPRIAGIETAVEWIASGKEYSATQALKVGVVDGVTSVNQLNSSAMDVLQQCIDNKLPYLSRRQQKQSPLRHNDIEKNMAFMTCKAMVGAQAGKHYPAPLTAVTVIEKAADLHRDKALLIESEAFVEMAQTQAALSLSGIFVNDQQLMKKAKQLAKEANSSISKAAVLGAGIMGGGVAYQSALKNIPIKLKDVQQAGLDLGLSEANKLLNKRVKRGRLDSENIGEVLNRIEPSLEYSGFDKVDIVVEAVVEKSEVKTAVLKEVEEKIHPEAILTSNTSTISIDFLAQSLQRPENFCGMHFFNPVHAMPLVEVIRGDKTSDNAIATTVAYAVALGKKAIVVKDCPGFLVNRVLFPYFAGFSLLLCDGVSFERIDKVMEKWGWPMGPAHLLDVVGLDTAVHASGVMADGFPERMPRENSSVIQALLDAQRLGQKNQKGFYDYGTDKKGKPTKTVSDEALEIIQLHRNDDNTEENRCSEEEIVFRMMIPMATELSRCLEENIVDNVAEADMALLYGLGFPPFRGGVFRWIDDIGIECFCSMAEQFQHLGESYRTTDTMKQLRNTGASYYSSSFTQSNDGGDLYVN